MSQYPGQIVGEFYTAVGTIFSPVTAQVDMGGSEDPRTLFIEDFAHRHGEDVRKISGYVVELFGCDPTRKKSSVEALVEHLEQGHRLTELLLKAAPNGGMEATE